MNDGVRFLHAHLSGTALASCGMLFQPRTHCFNLVSEVLTGRSLKYSSCCGGSLVLAQRCNDDDASASPIVHLPLEYQTSIYEFDRCDLTLLDHNSLLTTLISGREDQLCFVA